jgi:putative DNA primase/helicase
MLESIERSAEQALVSVTDASVQATVATLYPAAALKMLRLKCPLVRAYANSDVNVLATTNTTLRSGLNRTLANFDGGSAAAYEACRLDPEFDATVFNTDAAPGTLVSNGHMSCAEARAGGSQLCPQGGCTIPSGQAATAPVDLLTWDCNINAVPPAVIADSVVSSEFGCDPIILRDQLYVYDAGTYAQVSPDELAKRIMPHLGTARSSRLLTEVGKLMLISNVNRVDEITPNPGFICFKNGTLDLGTMQLETHSASHMLLNRIPHNFDADATCQLFLTFLATTFQGDVDQEQKIKLLQEWFGYSLIADTRLQKMLILQGEGANGKSVVMELAKLLVGPSNTTAASLHRLRMAHVRAELEGKLLNQSADLPKHGSVADGDLKAIVGGDPIEVSKKHKPSHSIRPYTRLMVATNHLPSSRDTSEGYFRRIMILTFNNIVPAGQRDARLVERLGSEIGGILAWAIRGLIEVTRRGSFTLPASSIEVTENYRTEISPITMFSEECLNRSDDRTGFAAKDVFLAFRRWCNERGLDAGDMISMGRAMKSLGFTSRKSNTTIWMVTPKTEGASYFNPPRLLPNEDEDDVDADSVELATMAHVSLPVPRMTTAAS